MGLRLSFGVSGITFVGKIKLLSCHLAPLKGKKCGKRESQKWLDDLIVLTLITCLDRSKKPLKKDPKILSKLHRVLTGSSGCGVSDNQGSSTPSSEGDLDITDQPKTNSSTPVPQCDPVSGNFWGQSVHLTFYFHHLTVVIVPNQSVIDKPT